MGGEEADSEESVDEGVREGAGGRSGVSWGVGDEVVVPPVRGRCFISVLPTTMPKYLLSSLEPPPLLLQFRVRS